MMVVIVVSRRVGQVTLAVSERTSCKNLNGLKAIVWDPRSVARRITDLRGSEQRPSAQPSHLKDEPETGLDCSGISKAAPDIRLRRAGCECRLCTARTPKGQGWTGQENNGLAGRKSAGRSGRARTCDPRFWRPVLYQLSYTPVRPN